MLSYSTLGSGTGPEVRVELVYICMAQPRDVLAVFNLVGRMPAPAPASARSASARQAGLTERANARFRVSWHQGMCMLIRARCFGVHYSSMAHFLLCS